ncbi:phytanoyl-CoA dioxygenase family protein [Candidatus Pelagibacter sp.]|nr:phytanoyl-CoA dioxygenase family protein [Candidatus Pelagibacter sp.]
MLDNNQILKFKRDGYIHLRKFFNDDEVNNFLQGVEKKKISIEKDKIDKTVDIDEVWNFICHSKMLNIVRSLIGQKIFYMHDASILNSETSKTLNHTWHRDNPCRKTGFGPDWNSKEKYNVVSSAVYLTESDSTLNIIKKSHLKRYRFSFSNLLRIIHLKLRKLKKFNSLKDLIESIIGTNLKYGAGDLIIFYTTLFHAGSVIKNSNNSYREGFISRYAGEGLHCQTFLNYEMNYRKSNEKYKISKKREIFFQKLRDNNIYISTDIKKDHIDGVFLPKENHSDSIYKL